MSYKSYKGWYTILNPEKFIKPVDEFMQSFKDGKVMYKSSLERKAIQYFDYNKYVKSWSCEPFHIKYIKPTDGLEHRYFIDFFVEFTTGDKFLVEVKSKGETFQPNPKNKGYQQALVTFAINQAKWKAAKEFAALNKMKFIILTETELN